MVTISVDVRGIKEVTDMLKDLTGKVLREVYWELYRVCDDTVVPNVQKQILNMTVPHETTYKGKRKHTGLVETAKLMNSIMATPVGSGHYKRRQVVVHDGVPYGIYHELGFHFSKQFAEHAGVPELEGKYMRNPFLRPGVMKSVPVIKRRLENTIGKNL